jgi:bacteriocin-like protein
MTQFLITDAGELHELTIDELDEVSGGLPGLTLAIGLLIAHLLGSP